MLLRKKDLISRGFVKNRNNFLKTTLLELSGAKVYRNYIETGLRQGWVQVSRGVQVIEGSSYVWRVRCMIEIQGKSTLVHFK